jgi:hypothetical protein
LLVDYGLSTKLLPLLLPLFHRGRIMNYDPALRSTVCLLLRGSPDRRFGFFVVVKVSEVLAAKVTVVSGDTDTILVHCFPYGQSYQESLSLFFRK